MAADASSGAAANGVVAGGGGGGGGEASPPPPRVAPVSAAAEAALAAAAAGGADGTGAAADTPPPSNEVYCYVPCSPLRNDYLERIVSARVYDVAKETPLDAAPRLSARLGATVLLKREDTQPVFSFKLRGAYNMMARASADTLASGVIAASAGNHAQGVALAAQTLGVPATIVMPVVTPSIKVDAVRARGATAVLHGDNFDQAKAHALGLAAASGALFVPPFDHPDVIAGQGTIGLELLRQSSDFDAVFVPVGGGGLIAGIAAVVKRLRPSTRVIGVEPADADAMRRSLEAGHRVRLDRVGSFADGVAVVEVGEETYRLCRELVDAIVVVDNDEICAAIKDVFEDTRAILEPAGALAVAGIKAYVRDGGVTAATRGVAPGSAAAAAGLPAPPLPAGQTYVAINSGANTNFDRLRYVSERAELGERREAIFAVTIPERRGEFLRLLDALGPGVNITEFNYRYSSTTDAHVYVGVGVANATAASRVLGRLVGGGGEGAAGAEGGHVGGGGSGGYVALDLTDNEMAKLHLRHLVGGAAPLDSGAGTAGVREVLYRFEFPERPGALRRFLTALRATWSITLFHYRNHGADVGRVLVGLAVPAAETAAVGAFMSAVSPGAVDETANPAYQLFLAGGGGGGGGVGSPLAAGDGTKAAPA